MKLDNQNFSDSVAMLSDNGAQNVLVPVGNSGDMAKIQQELLAKTNMLFYKDAMKLLEKGIVEE
ncbi:hypothetical protein [Halarsenatibacter silvermanii]|uniref:Lon protease (S16) C-terminal proteolytic domain-containing protein n=1 Tax=Halarsenatibacter silvermanii TaxID=321763 RepID=A0A1G9KTF6_9FIRM|nr:hypothetical protein [Halarsenatibacter silvermanii]SDL52854.1 hypothetical protein SAMN04488692_10596 [Halarsenatibacter silvermanii]